MALHRDLKPANIKITPEGRVKVLDFGLAKAFVGDQADVSLSNSPTLSMAATQAGIILGTAAHMSPEQASGGVADHRTDVWAFGVVLFEMLTGQPLFTGKTASHVMGAVLNIDPDWNRLPPNLNPRVRALLERCLEKEAKNRQSSISDARVEIQRILADPAGVVVHAEPVPATQRSRWGWVAAIILVALAGLGAWIMKPVPSPEVVRFEHAFPDGLGVARLEGTRQIAVSPGGRLVAYGTSGGLHLLSVGEFEARPAAGAEGVTPVGPPVFSPDGEWLAFYSSEDSQIKKVPVAGGAPVVVANLPTVLGMTWGEDNTILIGSGGPAAILAVSGDGGTPEPLFAPETPGAFLLPQRLPDGESLLLTGVESGTAFSHELPQRLIDWPYDLGREGRTYDIAPDGSRFLTTKAVDQEATAVEPRVRVALNWTQELLERVPIDQTVNKEPSGNGKSLPYQMTWL